MNFQQLLVYTLKKFVDFKFRKRSPFFWGLKYFSISLVVELAKLASDTAIDDFYLLVEAKAGLLAYALVWFLINIVFGGVTIFFSWLSITIKFLLIIFFSF